MSIKKVLLASLSLNVFLLGVEVYLVRENLGDMRSLPPLLVCIPPAEPGLAVKPGDAEASPAVELSQDYTVATIESAAFRDYVSHLRNLGCPDDTIRTVIATDVSEMFRSRVRNRAYTANRFEP